MFHKERDIKEKIKPTTSWCTYETKYISKTLKSFHCAEIPLFPLCHMPTPLKILSQFTYM